MKKKARASLPSDLLQVSSGMQIAARGATGKNQRAWFRVTPSLLRRAPPGTAPSAPEPPPGRGRTGPGAAALEQALRHTRAGTAAKRPPLLTPFSFSLVTWFCAVRG